MYNSKKWLQGASEKMKAKGTEGSFTKQAHEAGYDSPIAYADKVMSAPEGKYSGKTRKKGEFCEECPKEEVMADQDPKITQDNTDIDDTKSNGYYSSEYEIGQYSCFYSSDKPFIELEEDEKNALHEMVVTFSRTDVASRRMEVEQSWNDNLFERGYQHLLPRRGGGWQLPGESTRWGVNATADSASLFSTNTYGRDRDIIVSALCREIPRVEFYPVDPKDPQDQMTADKASEYSCIFSKNNNLRARQTEAANYFFIEDRVVFLTGYFLDGEKYGLKEAEPMETPEEEDAEEPQPTQSAEEPMSPEEAANLPPEEEEEEAEGEVTEKEKPNGRVIVKVYGKLSSKVPIIVNEIGEMQAVQLYDDVDVTVLKARYPWIADKIKPGTCGIGEIELDYIARLNVRLALSGAYVTGDSLVRQAVEQKTWLRPAAFFDITINKDLRRRLLKKFPTGALVVFVGQEFAFAREESMNDHLVIAHPFPGNGQNRRALGSSLIGPQKRLNNWIDLIDDFFRSTIPMKWMDNDAFNVEAVKQQSNKPGDIRPFQRQAGVPTSELVFVEPSPQHQPALPDFIMKFFLDVPQSLSGAVPSLFGGSITGQVGSEGYAIQKDQALERQSTPWNSLKAAFAEVFRQAVICAGANEQGTIMDVVPGRGLLTIDANDLKGSISCYPEYDSSIPESASERMQRDVQMIELAPANPYYAQLLQIPSNVMELANDSKLSRFNVPGAADIERQMAILQVLLKSGPKPNPQILEIEQKVMEVKQGIAGEVQKGTQLDPQIIQAAVQFEQQAQQQIQQLPPMISSMPPRQDGSENHKLAAAVDLEWMNSHEGRKYEHGSAQMKEAFANVSLNWNEHSTMAQKIDAENASAAFNAKENVSISVPLDKLPSTVTSQVLAKVGIQTTPQDFDLQAQKDTQNKIAQKLVPDAARENAIAARESKKSRRIAPPPQGEPLGQ